MASGIRSGQPVRAGDNDRPVGEFDVNVRGLPMVLSLVLISGCRGSGTEDSLVRGLHAYAAHCASCHGDAAEGAGPYGGGTPPAPDLLAWWVQPDRLDLSQVIHRPPHEARSGRAVWGSHLGAGIEGDIAAHLATRALAGEAGRAAAAPYFADPQGLAAGTRRDYVYHCSGCHGPYGGGEAPITQSTADRLAAPHLTDSLRMADLSDRALRDFIGLRGAHQQYRDFMPSWMAGLDSAATDRLVPYVRMLSRTEARP